MKSKFLFTLFIPLLVVGCGNSNPKPSDPKIDSLRVLTNPTKLEYTEGDCFDPTGLVLEAVYDNKVVNEVDYERFGNDFIFEPSLTTPLTTENTSVKVTYVGLYTFVEITVSEAQQESTFTADFTKSITEKDGISHTGDSSAGGINNFITALQTYYFNSEDIELTNLSGEYLQINTGDKGGPYQVTETRSYNQILFLGSKKKDVNCRLTFSKTIKAIEFKYEAYCKYIEYSSSYFADNDTYLKVNNEKVDITAHSLSDVDESTTHKFVVNSNTIDIICPNNNPGSESKGNRILVQQITLYY